MEQDEEEARNQGSCDLDLSVYRESAASQDNPHDYIYTGDPSSKERQDPSEPNYCSVESLKQHGVHCTQPAPSTLYEGQHAAMHQNLCSPVSKVNAQAVSSTKYQQPSGSTLQGSAMSEQQHGTTLQGSAMSQNQHVTTLQRSAMSQHQHGTTLQGPALSQQQHGTTLQGPEMSQQQHCTTLQGPAMSQQQYGTTLQGPAVSEQQQCNTLQGPAVSHQLPGSTLAVSHQLPCTTLQGPSVSHKHPGSTLQGPALSQQVPVTTRQGTAVFHHIPAELYSKLVVVTSSLFIDTGNDNKRLSHGLEHQVLGQNVQAEPVNSRLPPVSVIPHLPVISRLEPQQVSAEEHVNLYVKNHTNVACTSAIFNNEFLQQGISSNILTVPLSLTPLTSSTQTPQYRQHFDLHSKTTDSSCTEGQSVHLVDSHCYQEKPRNKLSSQTMGRFSHHSTMSDSLGLSINTNQEIISAVACHSQVSTIPDNMTAMSHLQTMAKQSHMSTTVSKLSHLQAVSTLPHKQVISTVSHLQAVSTETNTGALSRTPNLETVSAVSKQSVMAVSTVTNSQGSSVIMATSGTHSVSSKLSSLPQQDLLQLASGALQQSVSEDLSSKVMRNQNKEKEELSGLKESNHIGAKMHTNTGKPTRSGQKSEELQEQGLTGLMSSATVTVPLNADIKQGLRLKSAEQTPDIDTDDSTTQDPGKARVQNIITSKAGPLAARKQGSPSKVRGEVVSDGTLRQTRSSSRKLSSGNQKKTQQKQSSNGRRKHPGRKTRKTQPEDCEEQPHTQENVKENTTSPAPGRPVLADLTVLEADQKVLQQLVKLIKQLQFVDHQTLDNCVSKMLDQLTQQVHELRISTRRSQDDDSDCQVQDKASGKINTGTSGDEDNDIAVQDEPGKQKHICDVCGKAFTQLNNLSNHKRTHTGERPFTCEDCGKAFTLAHHLRIHMKIHSGERPFRCKVCNKTFIQSQHLVSHQRLHTGEKPYRCDVCGRSFAQRASLNKHKRTHTKEKPFQCDICGKHLGYSSSLALHKKTHTQEYPYQCQVCGKKFLKESGYTRHKRIHCPEERAFTCEFCGKTFTNSWSLVLHRRSHTGERPYPCDFCGRKFAISANLTKHKRTHTGEKPYMCHQCGKSFAQKSTLSTHMMAHVKPVACQYCGKGFARKWDMLKHLKVHTGQKYIPSSQSSG